MESLYVISPNDNISIQLKNMLQSFIIHFDLVVYVKSYKDTLNLKNKKILFIGELGFIGFDLPLLNFFEEMKTEDTDIFLGSTAAVIVHSSSELGTKRASQDIVYTANTLGCNFLGHPLVEATGSLKNFLTWQKSFNISLEKICSSLCSKLGERLLNYENPGLEDNKKITVLYSSPHKVSNTLDLWHMAAQHLKNYNIKEIQIENGTIVDCKGCPYKLCLHYGKQNSCFYGGVITQSVLPAVEEASCIVWLCPNYNDAISANLTATINRLTVLYYRISFHNKSMFGVVVSGNSGGDSVAKQLIGALNLNKGFRLPPYAIITETANNPKSIYTIPNIEQKAETFAKHITSGI